MLEPMKTPYMRVNQFQTFTEQVLIICNPLTIVAAAVANVDSAYQLLKTALQKDVSAGDRKSADIYRDKPYRAFLSVIRSEHQYPGTTEEKSCLTMLDQCVQKYGAAVADLTYDEESAKIDNMIEEIEAMDLTPLQNTGILRWIPVIKDANDAFKALTTAKIEKNADMNEKGAASKICKELTTELDTLFALIFSHQNINPTDELLNAIDKIEVLIESYR